MQEQTPQPNNINQQPFQPEPAKKATLWQWVVAAAVVALLISYLVVAAETDIWPFSDSAQQITSFEECASSGNFVMLSYPRQCRTPDGLLFVEEIEDPVINNWQTYRNEEMGIEFRYPSSWETQGDEDAVGIFDPDSPTGFYGGHRSIVSINLFDNPQRTALRQWIEKNRGDLVDFSSIEHVTVSNTPAIKINEGGIVDFVSVYVANDNMVFWLSAEPKDLVLFNQILSSFRFIESGSEGSLNFAACETGKSVFYEGQSGDNLTYNKIQIIGSSSGSVCNASVERGTEGGVFKHACEIPFTVGEVRFEKAYFGPIEDYCIWINPNEIP